MDIEKIATSISQVPLTQNRRIIAIAGAPASGKSSLAQTLAQRIPNACVLPMDGFHRDNADLEAHGLLARKGAPETFDVEGFERILRAIRTDAMLSYPTFDRTLDATVPAGGCLNARDETILVEGNYLLLNVPPWQRLGDLWDLTIMLNVATVELEHRLVARWRAHGHTQEAARARAHSNDLPNALFMQENSTLADVVVTVS